MTSVHTWMDLEEVLQMSHYNKESCCVSQHLIIKDY